MSKDLRSRRGGSPGPAVPPWLLAGGVAAVVIGLGGYLLTRTDRPPVSLAQIRALARSGEFASARQNLDRLRDWARGDAERMASVDAEIGELEAIRAAFDDLRGRMIAAAASTSYATQIEALKALEAGRDPAAAVAARLVRGQLSALRRQASGGEVEVAPMESAPTVEAPAGAPEAVSDPVADSAPVVAEGLDPVADVEPAAVAEAPQPLAGERQAAVPPPGDAAVDDDPAAPERRARRSATLTVLGDLTQRVDDAESDGDFERAITLLGEGAARVRDSDPLCARELDGRAADSRHLQVFVEGVAAALAARTAGVEFVTGGEATLVAVEAGRPRLRWANGEGRRDWRELRASAWPGLMVSLAMPPRAWLGAAVLAYRVADRDTAEHCLLRALVDDPTLAAAVDGVVRRGRGESDESGYLVVDDRFLARRFVAGRQRAAAMQPDLARALRSGKVETESFLSAALAPGPEAIDAVVLALLEQQQASVERLEAHAFRQRGVAAMAALRARLDAARASALQLIFDEGRYFHPYNGPSVTPERAASYDAVRTDVHQRVEAVRAVWEDASADVEIPEGFRTEVEVLALTRALLARFGEQDAEFDARLAWLRRVPAGRRLALRDWSESEAEARERGLWDRILAFNELACSDWSDAERELVDRTNADRMMFGRRPLAASDALHRAARAHASEMDELGYMGHLSTAPGRRTPVDRMRQEGYLQAAAENCATGGTPTDVYALWCGSSAHHRNLLEAAHTEFGVGNAGRHWAVDFGSGEAFRADAAFRDDR